MSPDLLDALLSAAAAAFLAALRRKDAGRLRSPVPVRVAPSRAAARPGRAR